MSTPKIKQTNISYSSAEKHAVKGGKAFWAKRYNPMCPPSNKTGFVKINNTNRNAGGGYTFVPFEEQKVDVDTSASSYSDFIHYNYGAASERQAKPGTGKEF